MAGIPEIQKFIFNYEGIINRDDLEDVWSIYRIQDGPEQSDRLVSLFDSLFKIDLHAQKKSKDSFYSIKHGQMYKLLTGPRGIRHLARIVYLICQFLESLEKRRLNYSNLRAENVILMMSEDGQNIDGIKLINYGQILRLGQSEQLILPEQADHLPIQEL